MYALLALSKKIVRTKHHKLLGKASVLIALRRPASEWTSAAHGNLKISQPSYRIRARASPGAIQPRRSPGAHNGGWSTPNTSSLISAYGLPGSRNAREMRGR